VEDTKIGKNEEDDDKGGVWGVTPRNEKSMEELRAVSEFSFTESVSDLV